LVKFIALSWLSCSLLFAKFADGLFWFGDTTFEAVFCLFIGGLFIKLVFWILFVETVSLGGDLYEGFWLLYDVCWMLLFGLFDF